MEMGEKIAIGGLSQQLTEKCPFQEKANGLSEEAEDPEDDDSPMAAREQANSGGTLGRNLESDSPGKTNTYLCSDPPPKMGKQIRDDTRRTGAKVSVPGANGVQDGIHPFTVAAHHLIPGNASLKPSDLKAYMTQGERVTSETGKSWEILENIGYTANGSHNGVWLPGNYAIRASSSPTGLTWSILSETHSGWCLNYVAATAKAIGAQFHDTHTEYSKSVRKLLDKIHILLLAHQETCDLCKKKQKVAPPYSIKERLYNLSGYFKRNLEGNPSAWKSPWYSSDRWGDSCNKKAFLTAFRNANKTMA